MLKTAFLAMLAIVGIFAAYLAVQPSEFTVRREAVLTAPPQAVFTQVNDLHKWQDWSPWAKLDPNAKSTFEGPQSGEGAKFGWSGNRDVGKGTMTITESKPYEHVKMRIEFDEPMRATNDTLFTFKPEGSGTRMTWEMSGHNGFIARAVCFFMNMDKTVGAMFEKGMSNLNEMVKA